MFTRELTVKEIGRIPAHADWYRSPEEDFEAGQAMGYVGTLLKYHVDGMEEYRAETRATYVAQSMFPGVPVDSQTFPSIELLVDPYALFQHWVLQAAILFEGEFERTNPLEPSNVRCDRVSSAFSFIDKLDPEWEVAIETALGTLARKIGVTGWTVVSADAYPDELELFCTVLLRCEDGTTKERDVILDLSIGDYLSGEMDLVANYFASRAANAKISDRKQWCLAYDAMLAMAEKEKVVADDLSMYLVSGLPSDHPAVLNLVCALKALDREFLNN